MRGTRRSIRACVLWKCLVITFSVSVWGLSWCLSPLAYLRFTEQQFNETIKRVQCFSVPALCLLTSKADYARMRNAAFYTLLPSLHTQYAKPVKPSKAPA